MKISSHIPRRLPEVEDTSFVTSTSTDLRHEELALAIQFVPMDWISDSKNDRKEEMGYEKEIQRLFRSWMDGTQQTGNQYNSSALLSAEGTWSDIRASVLERSPATSCSLPVHTLLEYEGEFVRVANLRNIGEGCLFQLIETAAADNRVLSVSVESRPVLLNYAARGILQSGTVGVEPFTAAGLTGEGHIVGVADSGLNDLSCFFYDNSKAYYTDQTTRSSLNNVATETKRRKVIQYVAYADGQDSSNGHGTHVVGAIAGGSYSGTFSQANGVAAKAKIAFFDIQASGSLAVQIADLNAYVFRMAYDAGARVYSNSWGSASYGMLQSILNIVFHECFIHHM